MVSDPIGDNKEFAIPDIGDVTVHVHHESKTSADDTATDVYFDHNRPRPHVEVRPDQVINIVSINGITLTDPITIAKDGKWTENPLFGMRYAFTIYSFVVRTTVANTNVRTRVKG